MTQPSKEGVDEHPNKDELGDLGDVHPGYRVLTMSTVMVENELLSANAAKNRHFSIVESLPSHVCSQSCVL